MNDLDQLLRDILAGHSSAIDCGQYDEATADIKQTLTDAGYMTAQDWLTRFKSELAADQPLHDLEHYEYLSKHALAIAERAAGVQ